MLADLTPEEYERWLASYQQEPWGDARADQRNAATTLWLRWQPSHEGEKPDLPDLFHPYWKSAEQKTESEVETYKKLREQGLDPEMQAKLKEMRKKHRGG